MTAQKIRLPEGLLPLLLTFPEARRLSGLGETKLRELIKARQLELVKIGSAARIPRASLEGFIETLRASGAVGWGPAMPAPPNKNAAPDIEGAAFFVTKHSGG